MAKRSALLWPMGFCMDNDLQEPNKMSHSELTQRVAHPVDRVAAALVDICFVSVLFTLTFAPFQKQLLIYELTEREEMFVLYSVFALMALIAVGLVYQFAFTFFKGATPGKLLFGLRVVDFWNGENPPVGHSALRSIVWWIDCGLLFIPHLAILSHRHRRAMHDRLADTVVVSVKGRYSQGGSTTEALMAKSLTALVGGVTAAIFVSIGFQFFSNYGEGRTLFEALNQNDWSCQEVTKAERKWPTTESRLAIALTLHGASLIDDECLDKESRLAIKDKSEEGLAYLSRAFVTSGNADLSDSYLEKACELNSSSEACFFSKLVFMWTERKWNQATDGFVEILENSSVFVKVWAVKHFERIHDYETEITLLDELWQYRPLHNFVNSHKVAAYWGQQKTEEARVAFQTVLPSLSEDEQIGLSGWFCYQELKNKCSKEVLRDCQPFKQFVAEQGSLLEGDLFALAHINYNECAHGESVDYLTLTEEMASFSAIELVYSARMIKEGNLTEAQKSLYSILESTSKKDLIHQEAAERLVDSMTNASELDEFVKEWKSGDSKSWGWTFIGRKVFEKYLALNKKEDALEIGRVLFEVDYHNKRLKQELAILNYDIGNKSDAWDLIKEKPSGRLPASQKRFEKIKSHLYREFGEK